MPASMNEKTEESPLERLFSDPRKIVHFLRGQHKVHQSFEPLQSADNEWIIPLTAADGHCFNVNLHAELGQATRNGQALPEALEQLVTSPAVWEPRPADHVCSLSSPHACFTNQVSGITIILAMTLGRDVDEEGLRNSASKAGEAAADRVRVLDEITDSTRQSTHKDEAERVEPLDSPLICSYSSTVRFLDHVASSRPTWNCSGQNVNSRELQSLNVQQLVSGDILNVYFGLIAEQAEAAGRRISVISTYVVELLSYYDYNEVLNRHQAEDGLSLVPGGAASQELVLLPINVNKNHWATLAIDIGSQALHYFDSMLTETAAANAFLLGRKFLMGEMQADSSETSVIDGWQTCSDPCFPQQTNGVDCGIFTAQAIRQLCESATLLSLPAQERKWRFGHDVMDQLRIHMFQEIVMQKLTPLPILGR